MTDSGINTKKIKPILFLLFVFGILLASIDFMNLPHSRAADNLEPIVIKKELAYDLSTVKKVTLPISTESASPAFSPVASGVFDLESRAILAQKNINQKRPIASLTKLMTVLVALDLGEPEDIITVKGNYTDLPAHRLGLASGDRISLKDLIASIMISSSNDSAAVISDHFFPGNPKKFIDLMNAKSKELGMANTHFSNMIGLDQPDNYSTVYDLSLMAFRVLDNKIISDLAKTTEKEIIWNEGGKKNKVVSTNKLLSDESVRAVGLKTGSTPAAGQCLISAVEVDGHSVLAVVLGAPDRFGNTKEMISWVEDNINWR